MNILRKIIISNRPLGEDISLLLNCMVNLLDTSPQQSFIYEHKIDEGSYMSNIDNDQEWLEQKKKNNLVNINLFFEKCRKDFTDEAIILNCVRHVSDSFDVFYLPEENNSIINKISQYKTFIENTLAKTSDCYPPETTLIKYSIKSSLNLYELAINNFMNTNNLLIAKNISENITPRIEEIHTITTKWIIKNKCFNTFSESDEIAERFPDLSKRLMDKVNSIK